MEREEKTRRGTYRTFHVIKYLCTLHKQIVIGWFRVDGEQLLRRLVRKLFVHGAAVEGRQNAEDVRVGSARGRERLNFGICMGRGIRRSGPTITQSL